MKIAVDTNVLSNLIKPIEDNEVSKKILKFLHDHSNNVLEIVIPNIVLSEIMSHFTDCEIDKLENLLEETGTLTHIVFDKKSAITNSRIVKQFGISADDNKPRQAIKTDYLIVANCSAYQCDYFLTADDTIIKKMSNIVDMKFIDVRTLPSPNSDLLGKPILD